METPFYESNEALHFRFASGERRTDAIRKRVSKAAKPVVIDFTDVGFISSGEIGLLLLLQKIAQPHRVTLSGLNPDLIEALSILNLGDRFDFGDGQEFEGTPESPHDPDDTLNGRARPERDSSNDETE